MTQLLWAVFPVMNARKNRTLLLVSMICSSPSTKISANAQIVNAVDSRPKNSGIECRIIKLYSGSRRKVGVGRCTETLLHECDLSDVVCRGRVKLHGDTCVATQLQSTDNNLTNDGRTATRISLQ